MKRLSVLLTGLFLAGAVTMAAAGDFHTGASLNCSDCHVAHSSQQHGYSTTGLFTPIGTGGPFTNLLRDEEVKLCLTCHNNQSFAPDVFGANGGTAGLRQAGGLNALAGHGLTNDPGYDEINGHTMYSTAMPPGGASSAYVPGAEGLICTNCHAQHGSATQYRNLLNRGIFTGDTLTYAVGTNDLTKDIFERAAGDYNEAQIDFNEPNTRNSSYGRWCQNCHVDFHGQGGDANMGGAAGGVTSTNATPWKRHPVADVNIGESGPSATFISSLARYAGVTNKVKVMDSQGLWQGTGTNTTLTPSCMSCHKGHGNKNAFGLIFMNGAGTRTEEGDGGIYKDLCRQCHSQGG